MNATAVLLLAAVVAATPDDLAEPTVDELEAIEAEAPVLAAELAVVDAECRWLICPSDLNRRHLRRTQSALSRALAQAVNHPCAQGALS